jgi:hypothetical protein
VGVRGCAWVCVCGAAAVALPHCLCSRLSCWLFADLSPCQLMRAGAVVLCVWMRILTDRSQRTQPPPPPHTHTHTAPPLRDTNR